MEKKLILFTLIAFFALQLDAQTKQDFYAIDGTTWVTKYDRDKKETLLWDEVELNLQAALSLGRLGAEGVEYHKLFKHLFEMCKESIKELRKADVGYEIMQNAEFRYYIKNSGVTAINGQARNKEKFNFSEYSMCFDLILQEYSFNATIIKELASQHGKEYNIQFIANDFAERMEKAIDRIERDMMTMDYKKETIRRLIPRFESQQERLNKKGK